jgi:hypothetical protein
MGSLRFELTVYGGIADDPEAKVAADTVSGVLKGMTLDIQEICRNLSGEDDPLPLDERMRDCRIYVTAPPSKGKSLTFPLLTGDSGAEWGVISMRAYASGVEELRESTDLGTPSLPRGFDAAILRRIRSYCQEISQDHAGFAVKLPAVNGTPALRATFDARLRTAVSLKIAAIEHAQSAAVAEMPDQRIYGYSLQGVLFEMSDPDYLSPEEGTISVEVDARDGRKWVCLLDKKIAPPNLQDLWRTEVLVTGDATLRSRKPLLEARTFKSLPGISDPVKAMEELVALCSGLHGEPVQAFMDRVRERD